MTPEYPHASRGEETARRHPRVQRSRQRVPRGGPRSRNPRRRQPAGRRAERAYRGHRLRDVHETARAGGARACRRGPAAQRPALGAAAHAAGGCCCIHNSVLHLNRGQTPIKNKQQSISNPQNTFFCDGEIILHQIIA